MSTLNLGNHRPIDTNFISELFLCKTSLQTFLLQTFTKYESLTLQIKCIPFGRTWLSEIFRNQILNRSAVPL